MNSIIKGKFIVFEGIDGSGTTSVSKAVYNEYRNSTIWTCEPSSGRIGKLLRELLSDNSVSNKSLLHLFFADRVDHIENIESSLNEGTHVICDRYYHSTFCYQSLYNDWKYLDSLHFISQILRPEMVFHLELPVQLAQNRLVERGSTKDIYENLDIQERVAENYVKMSHLSHFVGEDTIITIDATQSFDKVVSDCIQWLVPIL